ncbi:MAG: TIGR03905 family TSCPD domain-containing protein [Muribaculaceae bacterium]|nr:TIGR03905 family TSCPD domain-containing protein [Muribaculaceae bacterium]
MHVSYPTTGTCSKNIEFDIDAEGRLRNIRFDGGCPGNTSGISRLAEGADARTVACMLGGTDCRGRGTSCPDQLAKAIEQALEA